MLGGCVALLRRVPSSLARGASLAAAVAMLVPGVAAAACPGPYLGAGNTVCTTAGNTITCALDASGGNTTDPLYYSEGFTSGGNSWFRAFGFDDVGTLFCAEIQLTGTQLAYLVVAGTDRTDNNSGNDNIDGSNDAAVVEYLNGEGGNDTIDGKAGDDTIDGGTGNDTLTGGAGEDDMYGRAGTDTMYGGDDSDWMEGGDDADQMKGGDADDDMYGGSGADSVCGGPGTADVLYGGDDDDTLYSGSQTEYTFGDAGTDVCSGFLYGYATSCDSASGSCPW
ncbi:MAG: hypothetical protein FJ102_23075 [Deltaproteobacteria bacterium]|nr:hypothetical protein [Deltaproteobacteria bacterium]